MAVADVKEADIRALECVRLFASAVAGCMNLFGRGIVMTARRLPLLLVLTVSAAWAEDVRFVKDIRSLSNSSSSPRLFEDANGVAFFYATENDGTYLWKSDGSTAGTIRLKKVQSTMLSFLPSGGSGPAVCFMERDVTQGTQLWRTNGTVGGTAMVKDLWPALSAFAGPPQWITHANNALFFSPPADQPSRGYDLWKSDGTAAGTVIVKRLSYIDSDGAVPKNQRKLVMGGILYFAADDGTSGMELWKSDGTASGTVMVKDIAPYGPSSPHHLTDVNGTLFFAVSWTESGGAGIYKSDGTAQGTVLVKKIGMPKELTNVNGTLFFAGDAGTTGHDLWKSDGTTAGTVMVKSMEITTTPDDVSYFTSMNGLLFFIAGYDDLWKSDGTAAGTVRVKTVPPVPRSCYYLTAVNGNLFFSASTSTYGRELWRSDGTEAGTVMLADINPGTATSAPEELTKIGDRLFFSAIDPTHGREPWVVDNIPDRTRTAVKEWPRY